jgi:signal transduction histidine kinase
MTGSEQPPPLANAVARLAADPDSIPWPERRFLAKALLPVLSKDRSEHAVKLAHMLAGDPKWEVRKEIAELLLLLPEGDFLKLTAKLSDDDNAFVRNAVRRSLERRQQGRRESQRRRQGINRLESEFAAMERTHGRLAAEKARQMAERMYDILIGEIVHEMRGLVTPLKATTLTLLDGIEKDAVDQKGLRDRLSRMRDRLAFLERLIDDMRTYSQALGQERRAERLAEVVADAHAMALERLHSAPKYGASIKVSIDVPTQIVVEMARHQVVVALANVVKNAVEAVADRPGGRVNIAAEVLKGEAVQIVVQDNGPGRSKEDLAEIRDFVPGRTTMKNYGTGFGLPIARKNILAHGGRFEVESPRGRGFVVRMVLPVRQEESEEE